MAFNLQDIEAAVGRHDRVARVLVVQTSGSVPREAGASMLVWTDGQSGTIGGGALEYEAAEAARSSLGKGTGSAGVQRRPLGPGLGQCCGGSVTLVTEIFDHDRLQEARLAISETGRYLRAISGDAGEAPPDIAGDGEQILFSRNWIGEAASRCRRSLWLFGAGHVGRAVVATLAPLDSFDITWVDVAADRYPADIAGCAEQLVAANPADTVRFAPAEADHLVMTHSHALDLDICNRLLAVPFRSVGLIGSKSKWARFRKRLAEAGHARQAIDRIECPIGMPELGKHPRAIAIGLACRMLARGEVTAGPTEARP